MAEPAVPAVVRPFEAIGRRTIELVEALGRFGGFFGLALFSMVTPPFKTRAFIEHLEAWDAQGKVLLVLAGRDETVERSCANVREVRVILADSLNVVDLLEADTVIFTSDALNRAQEVYA